MACVWHSVFSISLRNRWPTNSSKKAEWKWFLRILYSGWFGNLLKIKAHGFKKRSIYKDTAHAISVLKIFKSASPPQTPQSLHASMPLWHRGKKPGSLARIAPFPGRCYLGSAVGRHGPQARLSGRWCTVGSRDMGPAEEADASRRSFNFVQGWVLGCLHSSGQDHVRILEQQAVSWRPGLGSLSCVAP